MDIPISQSIPDLSIMSDAARDAIQAILSGRKSWKPLRGTEEAVWSPQLEAALIAGLDQYLPETSNRFLLRFPNRNRFISDYIQKTTGKHRTPKQVGSRIQQLRDTPEGKQSTQFLVTVSVDTQKKVSSP